MCCDIGTVLTKSPPSEREYIPQVCKQLQRCWSMAGMKFTSQELDALNEQCFLCTDQSGVTRTCSVCMCASHARCSSACMFEVQRLQDSDILPNMFTASNMCALCCKVFGVANSVLQ